MKIIFCLLFCFFSLSSAESKYKVSYKIDYLEFKIYTEDDTYKKLSFDVYVHDIYDERIIYKDNEFSSYIDFKKLNENYILITKNSVGTNYHTTYIILEFEKQKLKKVRNLDFGNCKIDSIFVNKKNKLEFKTCNNPTNKFIPKLISPHNQDIGVIEMGKTPPTENELKKILEIIKKDRKQFSSLEYFMNELIYSGNINSAFNLYYEYDKLFPNEKNDILLNKVFTDFKNSRFFSEIMTVNNMTLMAFEKLMKKNKIVFEEY